MKQLLQITILFFSLLCISQEYNKNSLEFEVGLTKVRDVTSVKPLNFNIGYRYMPNTKFGAKLDVGYTNLNNSEIDYYTASLSGVINVGRLLEFESFTNNYTILAGVGGTFTHSNYDELILHRLSNFHLSGFVENEFKLSDKVFLQIGMDVITGVNSRPFNVNAISTETTSILNFNVGLVVALGKHKEHADWYIEEKIPVIDTLYMKPTINNYTETIDNTITKTVELPSKEYVFFAHDSSKITIQGLNAIKKIAEQYTYGQTIILKGYASPPASFDYNFKLSVRRCEAVKSKLNSLGITDVDVQPQGEIDTTDNNNVDLSRCVELTIK